MRSESSSSIQFSFTTPVVVVGVIVVVEITAVVVGVIVVVETTAVVVGVIVVVETTAVVVGVIVVVETTAVVDVSLIVVVVGGMIGFESSPPTGSLDALQGPHSPSAA
jgi:hypothetical protein